MVIAALIGCLGFIFYLIYDINSFKMKSPVLKWGFFLGSLCILGSTLWQIFFAFKAGAFKGFWDILLLIFAGICFAGLIYSLFFALPKGTYKGENEALCKSGVYALCRHPVAVCFLLTYLFLGLSALPSVLLLNGMTFSILNILYVLFQDIVTFPVTIKGYNEYKKEVPFLIPNKKSIRLAFETLKRQNRKEVK